MPYFFFSICMFQSGLIAIGWSVSEISFTCKSRSLSLLPLATCVIYPGGLPIAWILLISVDQVTHSFPLYSCEGVGGSWCFIRVSSVLIFEEERSNLHLEVVHFPRKGHRVPWSVFLWCQQPWWSLTTSINLLEAMKWWWA